MPIMNQPPPESLGIFTGFQIKYPEFTVVTPQTGKSYSVRCLNVSEVSRLKTSATTPAKATELINRTLWEAIVARPPEINDYDSFLRMTTLRDREALIYGLYVTTFGDNREFRVSCDNCSTERTLKVQLSNMFSITPYPGSEGMMNTYKTDKALGDIESPDPVMEQVIAEAEKQKRTRGKKQPINSSDGDNPEDSGIILGEKPGEEDESQPIEQPQEKPKPTTPIENHMVRVAPSTAPVGSILSVDIPILLPISKITCVIHQPTLVDEFDILNNVPFLQRKQSELINETLIIKRFEVYKEGDTRPYQIISNREDILRGYQSLPNPDKKEIYDIFKENFSDYGINLSTKWDCLNCGEENTMELEIVTQFFRMVSIS